MENTQVSTVKISKDVLQSYAITTAKYNFSIYEKRILYRIVEMLQGSLEGKKLNTGFKIVEGFLGGKLLTIPISSILIGGKNNKNYTQVKKAFRSFLKKQIVYENEKEWTAFTLIERPKIKKFQKHAEFSLHPQIYEILLNFSKGFRKYELEAAMALKSVYSMRFYELFSGQKQTMTFTIEYIKDMFQIGKKYKKINDFIKNVISSAKKELDESSPYSFTFTPVKTGKKITALTFTPIYHAKNRDESLETKALQKNVDIYWSISEKSKIILQDEYNFTTPELKRHAKLLERVEKELNLPMKLAKIKEKALKATNPKGYIIASLKNMIKVFENSNNFITSNIVKKQTRKLKKIKSNSIVDIEPILETKNEVLNETIVEINKVDNEQPKNKTSNTKTENNISDTEPALSFLQKISKWIICQFKRKE